MLRVLSLSDTFLSDAKKKNYFVVNRENCGITTWCRDMGSTISLFFFFSCPSPAKGTQQLVTSWHLPNEVGLARSQEGVVLLWAVLASCYRVSPMLTSLAVCCDTQNFWLCDSEPRQ